MANKFAKQDKLWFVAYVFVDVLAVIMGVLGVVAGVMIIKQATDLNTIPILYGIIVCLMSLIFAAFFWVIMKVVLSAYSDIKFIRNKMYCESNDMFDTFISDPDGSAAHDPVGDKDATAGSSAQNNAASLAEQLRELKQLADDGALSQSEFEQAKKKLLE